MLQEDEKDVVNDCDTIKTMEFEPDPTSWFDPDSWQLNFGQSVLSNAYAVSNYATFHRRRNWGQLFYSIPHSEQIPCFHDSVNFPVNGTYKVLVENSGQIPVLGSLAIGKQFPFSTNQFRDYVNSFIGNLLFDVRDYNHISVVDSEDRKCHGHLCACGNDHPARMKFICKYAQCPNVPCVDPIRPAGHCCDICATVIQFKSTATGAGLDKILDDRTDSNLHYGLHYIVKKHLKKALQSNDQVGFYLHWLYDGKLQLVVTNVADSQLPPSEDFVDRVLENMQKDSKF